MRGREFYMKDAYSFDLDVEAGRVAYNKMFVAYLRTYARMGLKAVPMRAETGPIGGDMSHEFIILADTGESEVFGHQELLDYDILGENVDFGSAETIQGYVDRWTSLYAATDEMHDPSRFEAEVLRRQTCLGARDRSWAYILFWRQIFETAWCRCDQQRRTGSPGSNGLLRRGRVALGGGLSRLVTITRGLFGQRPSLLSRSD